jgi:hypothetical protein
MDKRLYSYFVYCRLKKYCPEWPLSENLTLSFVRDFSSKYNVLAKNLDRVNCNINYYGIIIKKSVLINGINILNMELKRSK